MEKELLETKQIQIEEYNEPEWISIFKKLISETKTETNSKNVRE